MKNGKFTCLTIIFVLTIVLFLPLTGCVETENESEDIVAQGNLKEISYDSLSIFPDWIDGEYHNYEFTTKTLKHYEETYPDLAHLFSIGKSVLGKDIWCIKVTNEKNNSKKLSCVIDGCIHGSEWESGEICLYLADFLMINYGKNKTISKILNSTEVYLIPLLNPDGRDKDERWNENGIDLNRNFDVHYARIKGGSFRLGKLFGIFKIPIAYLPLKKQVITNAGRAPFSEPETQALRDFTKTLGSDFSLYVNCHTALHGVSSLITIEYRPEWDITQNEKDVIDSSLDWIEQNTEYGVAHVDDFVHPGGGFAGNWVYKEYKIPSFTFELLNMDYEPWYINGGKHDSLVHWMKASLPVLYYLVINIENFHNWQIPNIDPVMPDGVPPEPFIQKSSDISIREAFVLNPE